MNIWYLNVKFIKIWRLNLKFVYIFLIYDKFDIWMMMDSLIGQNQIWFVIQKFGLEFKIV